jgi:hypothetical protein
MEYGVSVSQLEIFIAEDDGKKYLDVDGTFYVLNSCLKGKVKPGSIKSIYARKRQFLVLANEQLD